MARISALEQPTLWPKLNTAPPMSKPSPNTPPLKRSPSVPRTLLPTIAKNEHLIVPMRIERSAMFASVQLARQCCSAAKQPKVSRHGIVSKQVAHPLVKICNESQCIRPMAGTVKPELTANIGPSSFLSLIVIRYMGPSVRAFRYRPLQLPSRYAYFCAAPSECTTLQRAVSHTFELQCSEPHRGSEDLKWLLQAAETHGNSADQMMADLGVSVRS